VVTIDVNGLDYALCGVMHMIILFN